MQVNIRFMKAAVIAASNEHTRYYLNGVSVQSDESNLFYVATDGTKLVALRQDHDGTAVNIIIPTDIIAGIKLDRRKGDIGVLTRDGETAWRLEYAGKSIIFAPIDGAFPDWRRVVPREYSGKAAVFNPEIYGSFAKIAKALGVSPGVVSILQNGDGPALIGFGETVDGFGVIMPKRSNTPALPAWF